MACPWASLSCTSDESSFSCFSIHSIAESAEKYTNVKAYHLIKLVILTSNKFGFPVMGKIAGEGRFARARLADDDKTGWSFVELLKLRFIFVKVILRHWRHLHHLTIKGKM